MVGTIFGKLGFVGVLVFKLSIGAERHMLHNMRGFVNIFIFYVAITGTELELKAHYCSARYVN